MVNIDVIVCLYDFYVMTLRQRMVMSSYDKKKTQVILKMEMELISYVEKSTWN